jgi:iron complex outermembrane receptor protein
LRDSGRLARALAAVLMVLAPVAALGQTPTPTPVPAPSVRETVTVTAQKEPADPRRLPLSLTTVTADTLEHAGVAFVSDAALYSPNTFFTEFSARKLSNPRFRGIGSSPANPGITTFFDGVPQLNTNTSSLDLLDIEQIEFVRGPQSALFGRNTLGGLINVSTRRPSLTAWTGRLTVPIGSDDEREVLASGSGPIRHGKMAIGGAIRYARRDGYTVNDLTGHDIDGRSAFTGKAQWLWTPAPQWETRVIVAGERSRDGDYSLSDLAGLRANPFHTARDFEGHTDRDVTTLTVNARREGARVAFSTTTGFVRWQTFDATDLDYTPLPLVTRDNDERARQFTQEVRVASAANAPVRLSDRVALRWQAGLFLFAQNYDQDAVNHLAPGLVSPELPFALSLHSPQAALDDTGVGVYGQMVAGVGDRLDLSVSARADHEQKKATLSTFFDPPLGPPGVVDTEKGFSDVSPQVGAAFRLQPDRMIYASVARGFKAGGFNPASPAGSEIYGEERAWHVEGGVKSAWAGGRLLVDATVFAIDWDDLQLNLPNPVVIGQFFIANVGGATSRGVELEMTARPRTGIDLFGSVGFTRARFGDGSVSMGADVAGRKLPNTPDYTAAMGAQIARAINPSLSLFVRGDVVCYGAFEYDEANTARQDAYALVNVRSGVRANRITVDVWIRNAFDTRYIPVAFTYPGFAPSGFIGEMGRPRTFGISAGVSF